MQMSAYELSRSTPPTSGQTGDIDSSLRQKAEDQDDRTIPSVSRCPSPTTSVAGTKADTVEQFQNKVKDQENHAKAAADPEQFEVFAGKVTGKWYTHKHAIAEESEVRSALYKTVKAALQQAKLGRLDPYVGIALVNIAVAVGVPEGMSGEQWQDLWDRCYLISRARGKATSG